MLHSELSPLFSALDCNPITSHQRSLTPLIKLTRLLDLDLILIDVPSDEVSFQHQYDGPYYESSLALIVYYKFSVRLFLKNKISIRHIIVGVQGLCVLQIRSSRERERVWNKGVNYDIQHWTWHFIRVGSGGGGGEHHQY